MKTAKKEYMTKAEEHVPRRKICTEALRNFELLFYLKAFITVLVCVFSSFAGTLAGRRSSCIGTSRLRRERSGTNSEATPLTIFFALRRAVSIARVSGVSVVCR